MACILAPMLERLFLSSVPTMLTAVSDWLPSVFSRLHMSPLMLVLLVMFIPPEEPICLFFILDAKSLSATTIDRGACEDRRGEEGMVKGVKGEMMEEKTAEEIRRCCMERGKGQISGTGVHDFTVWLSSGFKVDVLFIKTVND